jgi:glycosyltransferase involved in cell wall biosynthesis
MISILTWSYNRQEMWDITIPAWLKQEGVEFEIVAGYGPGIKGPKDPRVNYVFTPELRIGQAYNLLIKAAKGNVLMLTQADMQVNSPHTLKRLYDMLEPGFMVTEKFIKDSKRDYGLFLQMNMMYKADLEAVGGWDEIFDGPDTQAFEDSHIVASLIERGICYKHLTQNDDDATRHIDHPKPDFLRDTEVLKRMAYARKNYLARHKYHLPVLYYKQLVNQRRKGLCPMNTFL